MSLTAWLSLYHPLIGIIPRPINPPQSICVWAHVDSCRECIASNTIKIAFQRHILHCGDRVRHKQNIVRSQIVLDFPGVVRHERDEPMRSVIIIGRCTVENAPNIPSLGAYSIQNMWHSIIGSEEDRRLFKNSVLLQMVDQKVVDRKGSVELLEV